MTCSNLTPLLPSLAFPFFNPPPPQTITYDKEQKLKINKRQRLQKHKLIRPNCQTISDDREEAAFNFTEWKIVAFGLLHEKYL